MGTSTLHHVRYAGMASCVPRTVLSNVQDCPPAMRSERERLVRNIGIHQRRMCFGWQCFSDLAVEATGVLLADLGWAREEVDAVIVVTQSPDYLIPATAIILQDRLGLPKTSIAFDVNLGCSGYTYGLQILGSLIASGAVKKGLLMVGDKSATVVDPLFSDAGTVTALEYVQDAPPMYFDMNSDGSGYKAIMLPVGGHREPYGVEHTTPRRDEFGVLRWLDDLVLDGPAVLSFSTQQIPPAVRRLMEFSQMADTDIDYFLFHQANKLINETIRKKLGLSPEKVPSTLADFGNTSGASIPVTMTARLREALLGGRKRLLMSGFGIGLSWGSCIVDIEGAKFPEMVEL